jgi:hypothetical protein
VGGYKDDHQLTKLKDNFPSKAYDLRYLRQEMAKYTHYQLHSFANIFILESILKFHH